MSGSFLDTTIVINITDDIPVQGNRAKLYIAANPPVSIPYYAFQELLAGYIRIICETHNIILAASNPGEALQAMASRNPIEGRKKNARIQILASVMLNAFAANPQGGRNEIKRELLQALATQATRVWRKSRKIQGAGLVQQLACFNDGNLSFGLAGDLKGPDGSFNCHKNERCAAAAYLASDQAAVTNMIAALHSSKLPKELVGKTEITQRRKALETLKSTGAVDFPKRMCRSLGDAYFAAMCPAGSVVLTSNLVDHQPLCVALGKQAKVP